MGDSFFDRGERVGGGHWYVHPARGDHRRRLHDRWRNFGRNFRVAQPKPSHGERLENDVQRVDGHRTKLMAAKLTSVPWGESVAASTPVAGPLTPSSA